MDVNELKPLCRVKVSSYDSEYYNKEGVVICSDVNSNSKEVIVKLDNGICKEFGLWSLDKSIRRV